MKSILRQPQVLQNFGGLQILIRYEIFANKRVLIEILNNIWKEFNEEFRQTD